jgi:signal transduction histidine kinase
LALINEEVDRLSSLSRRVNDYLREGKGNPEVFDLYEFVSETGARLCGHSIMSGDTVSEQLKILKKFKIFADPERFRSVFENLIRNALESGGPAEAVEVSLGKSDGTITAIVRDRGKGIAEADMGRIFDPFFTKKSGGTGIGLSICKRFVEAAGGSVVLENRSGGGAEAKVILPEFFEEKREKGGTE